MLCEISLTFKLRRPVIPGLFLDSSDIQMVKVKGFGTKYWLLVASVLKYCPCQSILVHLQCVLACVCACMWCVMTCGVARSRKRFIC